MLGALLSLVIKYMEARFAVADALDDLLVIHINGSNGLWCEQIAWIGINQS